METGKVGYAMIDEDAMDTALCLGCDSNAIVNVEIVLDADYDEPPTYGEQRLIDICREAKSQGIEDVIVFLSI